MDQTSGRLAEAPDGAQPVRDGQHDAGATVLPPPGTKNAGPASTAPGSHRRLGGTIYQSLAPTAATASATPASTRHRRRKRRHRRRWYRRPLLIIPVTLVFVVMATAGFVFHRAESTIATLQSISTPPPIVNVAPEAVADSGVQATSASSSTATARVSQPAVPTQSPAQPSQPQSKPVAIDTGPAQAAVATDAATRQTTQPQGGLLGIRNITTNVKAMANGAAVAAGIEAAPSGPLNILVMGVDARPGQPLDIAVRPDAMMVVHLDPTAATCRLLAIPRDTRTNLPGYGLTKINHALMVGGIPYERLVVEQLLGLHIDRYALIDFTGYQDLVNAVGGVTITIPDAFVGADGTQFFAGTQHLTGQQALSYARYRGGQDGDFGRIRRQQQIIQALAQQVAGRDVARDTNQLLPAFRNHIRTDLSPAELIALFQQYRTSCAGGRITMDSLQGSVQLLYDPMFQMPLDYVIVDPSEIHQKVAALLRK